MTEIGDRESVGQIISWLFPGAFLDQSTNANLFICRDLLFGHDIRWAIKEDDFVFEDKRVF